MYIIEVKGISIGKMSHPDEEKATLSQPKGRKSSGGDICSLPFCSNGFKDGVSLHKLPADPGLQRKWLQFVSKTRSNDADIKHVFVCSNHFVRMTIMSH